ncbi:MAG: endonuclease/exonuclease/phosphatase family protein [Acetobacteraceae bacterium]|nr:endonuclease/exonuclease/phosphatase family protein [Acetobacteraceae bacterium]
MRRAILLISLLLAPCWAAAAELKLSTWNLEWLTLRPAGDPALPPDVRPKSAADRAVLRQYAAQLAADVVALQEVEGPEAAATIFPPPDYVLHFTRDRVVQRVGFAVRRAWHFIANPDLVALNVTPGARNPLRAGADITLVLPGGRLRLLAVHLKTGCREDRLDRSSRPQCHLLRLQLAALQGWIAQRRDEGVPFVLMGDFNRWMDPRETFFAGLQQAAPLTRATEGHSSPCWGGGGFVDHIIAGGAARAWMRAGSLRVTVYREQGAAAKAVLSDHCPVSARFAVPE